VSIFSMLALVRESVVNLASIPSTFTLCFQCSTRRRHLRSFPTRRSSDLTSGHAGIPLPRKADPLPILPPRRDLHGEPPGRPAVVDRKSTRLNSSHVAISYAVFCLKKKN